MNNNELNHLGNTKFVKMGFFKKLTLETKFLYLSLVENIREKMNKNKTKE